MKVVFFSGGIERSGGTEKVLTQIANGLSGRGYEVIIISLTGKSTPFFHVNEKIKIMSLESPSLTAHFVQNLRKLLAFVSNEKPDIWIDVDIILSVYSMLLKAKNRKMFLISWNHFKFDHQFERFTFLRKIVRKLTTLFSDGIVVLTDSDKGRYEEKYRIRGIIKRIYNSTEGKAEWICEKEKIVLSVGRLENVKGYDRLLEAWEKINKQYSDWRLVIVGEGTQRAALEEYVSTHNLLNVFFEGRKHDLKDYYRKASIYALPSRSEGFALVILEAMTFSVPVVAFSCFEGIDEVLKDGTNGLLAENGNIGMLADKLSELMSNEEKRTILGENAYQFAACFDIEKALNEWEGLFSSLREEAYKL